MRTRKIGERFEYEGVTLEVVEDMRCMGCYFDEMCERGFNAQDEVGECTSLNRPDRKSVKFVQADHLGLIKEQIDYLLHEANQMEGDYAGKREEEFYSGMIHGLELMKDFIKRKFQTS